jgi:hypothetical protein
MTRAYTRALSGRTKAGVWFGAHTLAADDDQERSGRLLLLGKGAVLAHRSAYPLAAESDDTEPRS